MPSPSSPTPTFDTAVLDQLACPACMGELRQVSERLVCLGCGRGYPILGGIPVLIVGRAERAQS